MLIELVLFIFLIIILVDYLQKRHRYELVKKAEIPGFFTIPILGNALPKLNGETLFEFFRENLSNKHKMFHFWLANKLTIVSSNVKDLEVIMSNNQLIEKNFNYEMISAWLGDGLLTSKGKKWHQRRKIITPTFHFKILEQFVEIFDQQSDILVEKLAKYADGKTTVNIFEYICLAALDVISASAMGVTVGAQQNDNFGYTKASKESSMILSDRMRSPILVSDFGFRWFDSKNYKLLADNIEFMQSFTKGIIRKRRQILEKGLLDQGSNEIQNVDEDLGTKKRAAFLDVLLQATVDGQPLSDEDIREEVETFMFEGHDTTTSGVSFSLYLIARHPEVQQRLLQEIHDVLGDDKHRPVTLRDLQELKYLECVIKESLRVYPPVVWVGRHFPKDVKINDTLFPAGTNLSIAIYHMLNDPDNFSNPHIFDPERFSGDNVGKIDPFAYIPFSAGSRNCIGQKFAMLEMKSMISKMILHYELLPLGAAPIKVSSLVLKSANGVNLGLCPRV